MTANEKAIRALSTRINRNIRFAMLSRKIGIDNDSLYIKTKYMVNKRHLLRLDNKHASISLFIY